jgi:hypothetical protein
MSNVLGCDAVWTYRSLPRFRKNILPPVSELNMESKHRHKTEKRTTISPDSGNGHAKYKAFQNMQCYVVLRVEEI